MVISSIDTEPLEGRLNSNRRVVILDGMLSIVTVVPPADEIRSVTLFTGIHSSLQRPDISIEASLLPDAARYQKESVRMLSLNFAVVR